MTDGGPSAALLLLADGRLPTGSYAHSGGVETAAARGLLRDTADLSALLVGRLWTAGATAAALAATGCRAAARQGAAVGPALRELDAEADARTPSPAQRAASRAQGRALLRLARRAWPSDALALLGSAPHAAVALGVVAASSGLPAASAALLAAQAAVSGPAAAAVRLLGLDPLEVAALQARLSPQVVAVAARAAADPGWAPGAPLLDLLAEEHAASGVPLFAS